MQTTHVESLDRTIQKTNEWLKAIAEHLGTDDRQLAYHALRATLHALRDRIGRDEAFNLGAQLPTLIRGVYFEGWRHAAKPLHIRDRDEFLGVIVAEAGGPVFESERAARAVFHVLAKKVSPGEIEDVKGNLPASIRGLWP
jgi:uncharacterized protein (DUF2267 family)